MGRFSNTKHISSCPVCRNTLFAKIFTKKGKDFWRCTSCGLEWIYPLPSLKELKDYYDKSYADGMYKIFINARQMKQITAKERLRQISSHLSLGTLLDVGCADGVFVEEASLVGFLAEGIDLSEVAVQEARRRKLAVYFSSIEDFKPGHKYNAVTAFDVLEHVLDPNEFLKAIYNQLQPEGKIIISVPNQGSIVRKLMGKSWYFYIPEEHLHYFNKSTITKLLSNNGFTVEQCMNAYKPLTYSYSLTQFKEYNPIIYRLLSIFSNLLPDKIQHKVFPLYIGEIIVIARTKNITQHLDVSIPAPT